MLLQNKVALVTGAASGIGREIARAYAREGAKVVVADLQLEAARAAAAEFGGLGVAMDVANERHVEEGVRQAADKFGPVDILVSNAGIQIISPLVDLDLASWRKMLAVHLDGAFLTTRACMRQMIAARRGGTILYMGSVHSTEASPLKSPYVTAKHGLLGLCRTVAKEGAEHGIRANVICPGFVRTPLVERQIPEQAQKLNLSEEQVVKTVMLKNTVDGEFTTLADVAEVAIFFAAFNSNALTGQSIIVSHGWHMQ